MREEKRQTFFWRKSGGYERQKETRDRKTWAVFHLKNMNECVKEGKLDSQRMKRFSLRGNGGRLTITNPQRIASLGWRSVSNGDKFFLSCCGEGRRWCSKNTSSASGQDRWSERGCGERARQWGPPVFQSNSETCRRGKQEEELWIYAPKQAIRWKVMH